MMSRPWKRTVPAVGFRYPVTRLRKVVLPVLVPPEIRMVLRALIAARRNGIGCWTGSIGQYYKAWSPLPKDGPAA